MVNVKDPGKYTRSVRHEGPHSPEEHEAHLAPYAWGPDDLEAAPAGLSREDLDQARAEHWTIICLAPGLGAGGARASLGAAMRAIMRTERPRARQHHTVAHLARRCHEDTRLGR
jgi:hypothetical protein